MMIRVTSLSWKSLSLEYNVDANLLTEILERYEIINK